MPKKPSPTSKQQGVTIKVVSGDNPATVSAIAQKAGIKGAEDRIDARTLHDERRLALRRRAKYTVFFIGDTRAKKSLCRRLAASGHKVAMTGDGVNDILAPKQRIVVLGWNPEMMRLKMAQVVLLDSDFERCRPSWQKGGG